MIDQFLDLGDLHRHLAPYYSHTGRPSIDPQLLIRMLIVGYCFGIRSERRLCEEVHLNLAYRWFCRLGLEAKATDRVWVGAEGLEWTVPSPAPYHTFETAPVVK